MIWFIGPIWLIGVLLSTPLRLRARMLGWVCPVSGRPPEDTIQVEGGWACRNHTTSWCRNGTILVRRGAHRDRNGADVAIAFARALYWPVQLIAWACMRSGQKTGRGITWLVDRITPLTEPERERRTQELEARLAKQQREIERLSAKL